MIECVICYGCRNNWIFNNLTICYEWVRARTECKMKRRKNESVNEKEQMKQRKYIRETEGKIG